MPVLNKYTFFINSDDEYDVYNDGDNYEDMINGTFGTNKLLLINSNKIMMMDIINSIVKESKTLVESIHFNSSNEVVAFVHPLTDVIYSYAPPYDMRKDIMTKLHEKLNIEELKFKNQSFPEIASNILTYFLDKEPEASEYNHQVLDIIDTYYNI